MRALTGAIIAAGAMIGLGLTALGLGLRYQNFAYSADAPVFVRFSHLDTALMVAMIVLLAGVLVGLITAFLGLAYHHERRIRERDHLYGSSKAGTLDA